MYPNFDALLILNGLSYIADVGAYVPFCPLSNAYLIVYVFGSQNASSFTFAPLVGFKFLKNVLLTSVSVFGIEFVTFELPVPCNAVAAFNPSTTFHPINVYPVFVGFDISTLVLYVPVDGFFEPNFPPFVS